MWWLWLRVVDFPIAWNPRSSSCHKVVAWLFAFFFVHIIQQVDKSKAREELEVDGLGPSTFFPAFHVQEAHNVSSAA